MKRITAIALLLIGAALSAYNFRAFLPYPGSYVGHLQYLKGWSSEGFYAFNCSGFISHAHGEEFMNEREMYAGAGGKLQIIAEYSDRSEINEALLQPGDVAAFKGPTAEIDGLHVAAFLHTGLWIDGDSRRGNVGTYRLQDKPASDEWFTGKVRILRWTTATKHPLALNYFAHEQAAIQAD